MKKFMERYTENLLNAVEDGNITLDSAILVCACCPYRDTCGPDASGETPYENMDCEHYIRAKIEEEHKTALEQEEPKKMGDTAYLKNIKKLYEAQQAVRELTKVLYMEALMSGDLDAKETRIDKYTLNMRTFKVTKE